jgi:hypothetical protein
MWTLKKRKIIIKSESEILSVSDRERHYFWHIYETEKEKRLIQNIYEETDRLIWKKHEIEIKKLINDFPRLIVNLKITRKTQEKTKRFFDKKNWCEKENFLQN